MDPIPLLRELVAIPSWVGPGSDERRLAEFLEKIFREKCPRLEISRQPVRDGRFNLLVKNSDEPEVCFLAHLDTVPPSAAWPHDPFVPELDGDRLSGLGAVDMKAGLAGIVTAILDAGAAARPFAAIFSCGEEYDFCGTEIAAREIFWKKPPKIIVNPEPTDEKILTACRGVLEFSFEIRGRSGHTAIPGSGVNAIETASMAVDALHAMLGREKILPELGPSSLNLAGIEGGIERDGQLTVRGNVVPDRARVTAEIRRGSPNLTASAVRELLERSITAQGAALEDFQIVLDTASLATPVPAELLPAGMADFPRSPAVGFGYFDAQILNEAWGSPVVIFGPKVMKNSHNAGEWVSVESARRVAVVLREFLG